MNFKPIIFIGVFLLLFFWQSKTQNLEKISTDSTDISQYNENDTSIVIPFGFISNLDQLLHSWALQRIDTSCSANEEIPFVNDSIYKVRLSQMPCLIEMPFHPIVRSFIELYTVQKRTLMEYMLGMSNYYFPIFEQILDANKLPLELKYLPIIESALNPVAISRMGAAGLWQFMISTGKMYGLEINTLIDERLDPVKSTKAAARFLKDLYDIYGDWNLVIAAYNCGPGNVNKAIRRAGGKTDYWTIYPYLPTETRGYLPIFIAATYSFHYAAEHNLCPAIVDVPAITDTFTVHQRIHFEQIASVLRIPIEEIRWLNPQYRKDIVPGDIKPYIITLPLNYSSAFIDKFEEIIAYKADELINNRRNEITIMKASSPSVGGSGKVIYHKVRKGETLGGIAAKYGVSVSKLKKWNNIRGTLIKPGQRLKIIK